MPLSEDEQRILSEIEQEFYDSDPEFAREVSETTLYKHAIRRLRWATVFGLAGLIGIFVGLQFHVAAAAGAFLIAFGAAVVIERNVRAMGKLGVAKVSSALRGRRSGREGGGLSDRIRRRFER